MEKTPKPWHPRTSKPTPNPQQPIPQPSPPSPWININKHMDCKQMSIPISRLEVEHRISKWRYETDYPVLKIYHFSYQPVLGMGPGSGRAMVAKVVYEVPDRTLDQLPSRLPLDKCLYIMKAILMGLQKLVQQFGSFKLSKKMIGFTEEGYCKIWVNENLWSNQVQFPIQDEDEQECVEGVKEIIEEILGQGQGEIEGKFVQLLRSGRCGIVKMIQKIWEFSYENSILIPPYLHLDLSEQSLMQGQKQNMASGPNGSLSNRKRFNNIRLTHKKTQSNLPSPNMKKKQQRERSIELRKHRQSQKYCNVQTQPPQLWLGNFNKKNNFSLPFWQSKDQSNMEGLCGQSEEERITYRLSETSQYRWSELGTQSSQDSSHRNSKLKRMDFPLQVVEPLQLQQKSKKQSSKSDFITFAKARLQRKISNCSTSKDKQDAKTSSYTDQQRSKNKNKQNRTQDLYQARQPVLPSALPSTGMDTHIDIHINEISLESRPNTNTNSFTRNPAALDEKTQKMKNLIKQKIRVNREKKKVVKLQAISTVKSIGEFTESEKRIIEENGHNNENGSMHMNINLEILQKMCKKTGTSYFHIDVPNDSEDEDQEDNGKDESGSKEREPQK